MKKILFAIVALMFMSIASAQDNASHMDFRGIPITGTPDSVLPKLVELGYTEVTRDSKIIYMEGFFTGRKVQLQVHMTERTKTVWMIMIYFGKPTSWGDLQADYFHFKKLLSTKYGAPTFCSEDFKRAPYNVSGIELRAVSEDYCDYSSAFMKGNGGVGVAIYKDGLHISYSDNIGRELMKKERGTTTNNDF